MKPPRITQDMDVLPFEDGLRDIIPAKIEQLLARMEQLENQHELWQEAITKCFKTGKIDDSGVYYWSLWSELEFSEYDILQKWLQYWLALFEKLPGSKIAPINTYADKLTRENDLLKAKTVPIENFYQGKLRGSVRLNGLCPFHEEKTPSFYIFTNNNTWHCFGVCGDGGDVISFVMKLKGLSFIEAMEILK